MSTHKHFDKICCVVLVFTLMVTALFMNAESFGIQLASKSMGYEEKLFDTSTVHTVNILMDDWEEFLSNCESEEYYNCTVVIDNEAYKNVGIRGKGNTSLTQVKSYGNNRYSFKIEFDHYDSTKNYHGLDKLCLNNIIQDNTYMKEYLTYEMMCEMGVASPLCSYTYIMVNGEDWGLYLAVEAVEESFLQRNYGKNYGELYKPDSTSMGGGRGNGDMMNSSEDVLLKYIDDEISSYSNIFDNAKTNVTDSDKTRLIQALKDLSEEADLEETLDIASVIKYFVVHNFVLNFDSYTGSMIHNYYLYENEGQMQMIPWDYNLAFGGFQSISGATSLVNYPIDDPISDGSVEDRPMIAWILDSEEYTEQYHQYFEEFIITYFDSGYFATMMDEVTVMIAPYVEKDPTKFCTYEEFELGAATLKEFCILRAESISGQLAGTIGSTFETQQNDALIDAGELQISDMGTMNQDMGGGDFGEMERPDGKGDFGGMEKPDGKGDFGGMEKPDGKEDFGGMEKPDGKGDFGGMEKPDGKGDFGGMEKPDGKGDFGGIGKR